MSTQKQIMQELLEHAVHFGHKSAKWNPKMAPYLYGKRNGVHIFDLNKTYEGLMAAAEFLKAAKKQGKSILFVSTKQQSVDLIKDEAEKCGLPYVNSKWIPGLLTNFKTVRARVKHMQDLKAEDESGELERKYTKKEVSDLRKEWKKLEAALGGVSSLEKPPQVIFVLDAMRDKIAIKEAKSMGITVVAIGDSNIDPNDIDYLIPGNDDAIKSINYLVTFLSKAIQEGSK